MIEKTLVSDRLNSLRISCRNLILLLKCLQVKKNIAGKKA